MYEQDNTKIVERKTRTNKARPFRQEFDIHHTYLGKDKKKPTQAPGLSYPIPTPLENSDSKIYDCKKTKRNLEERRKQDPNNDTQNVIESKT
ncbi:5646_t:CDS:1, partial [Gigaspora rosea]